LAALELGDGKTIYSLSFSTDGTTAAVGYTDGLVRLWDVATKKRIGGDLKATDKEIMDLALTPDKKMLVTSDRSGQVKLWDLDRRKAVWTREAHKQKVVAVVMSPDGKHFATAAADNVVKLWERDTGKELRQRDLHVPVLAIPDPKPFVRALLFTPDGKQLVTGNADTTLYLLDCP
jgi:WD40 repeat protein